MGKLVAVFVLVFGSVAFASLNGSNAEIVSKSDLDRLAGEFYVQQSQRQSTARFFSAIRKSSNQVRPNHNPNCDDDWGRPGRSCVDEACARLGKFNCDDISEVDRVGQMCRGNWDGTCVASVCDKVGKFNCDDFSEMQQVTALCRDQRGGDCMDVACKHVGKFNCDDISEVEQIGRTCQGVDASCLESVCQKVGKFNCDDISEIERVASSCRGN